MMTSTLPKIMINGQQSGTVGEVSHGMGADPLRPLIIDSYQTNRNDEHSNFQRMGKLGDLECCPLDC
jgi:hypothetical protein